MVEGGSMVEAVQTLRETLVAANRILAREEVVDAFGHVSARHPLDPDRFLLSRSLSPALVTAADIMEFDMEGRPISDDRDPYLERFIHAGIYARRPDVQAVVHHHAHEVIPFTVTNAPLRPIVHMAGAMGNDLRVWDIRELFGDTSLLVTNMAHADDLANTLGANTVALMRGHGAVVAAGSVRDAVLIAIYTKVNAGLLLGARSLGDPTYLSPGEILLTQQALLGSNPAQRAWDHYVKRAMKVDKGRDLCSCPADGMGRS